MSATSTDAALRIGLDEAIEDALGVLETHGLPESAPVVAQLRARVDEPVSTPRVVVVGEGGRGKSTLVNALVDQPGLSPVGASTGTGYVVVVAEPVEEAYVVTTGADGVERITVDQMHARAREGGPELRVAFEAHVEAPRLGDVVVVDTPGLNASDESRTLLTQRLVAAGGMVILTVDAGSPIATPELVQLEVFARDVEVVAVAVTMADKYPGTAADIVDSVRRRLAERSARLGAVPLSSVSAKDYEDAAALPDGPLRDQVRSSSGVPALQQRIAELAPRAEVLRAANVLRSCRSQLDEAGRGLDLLRNASEGTVSATDQQELEERVRVLHERRTQWPARLDRDVSRLVRRCRQELRDSLWQIQEETEEALNRLPVKGRAAALEALTARFSDQIHELRLRVREQLHTGLAGIANEALDDRADADSLLSVLDLGEDAVGRAGPAPDFGQRSRKRIDTADAVHVAAAAAMSFVAGPGALVYSVMGVFRRGGAVDASERNKTLHKTLNRLRDEILHDIEEAVGEIRPEILWKVNEHLRAQHAAATGAVNRANVARVSSAQERKTLVAQVEARKAAVTAALQRVDAALAEVHAARTS
ncbi:dynamin family protein [Nocardioides bigeumensis]|uniref:Dynamin N-terminal domain-containing protein n=1 Tax=Nocardioides bigeumensis TaxID=433657 RepID=A0ABN2YCU4_9ACTN